MTAAAQGKRPSRLWLQGLACGAVVTLATPSAVLLGILMAPTAAVFVIDPRPGRPAIRPMLLCGLAATLPFLMTLWRSGHTLERALGLSLDPGTIAAAWSAQAAGWLLAELVPLGMRLALDKRNSRRRTRLQAERTRYEEDWGIAELVETTTAPVPPPKA